FQSSWTIEYGEWHHFVFHRIGGFLQLYVDGVPKGHYLTQKTDCTNDQPIWLGCNHGNLYTQNLNGMLDEVRIYNRSLSELEIYALYEASALGINVPYSPGRMDIYPNPASREVRVDAGVHNRLSETASIQLLNTAGQIIKSCIPKGRITVISLEDVSVGGVYMIRMLDAGGAVLESRKLVVQK
ncbi:MAG TPA: T9SS type A sorting domain-containing protein, partial [Lentimicrobium sp.]|nr:T9SS type A sorting domain-containing protein [Lentimicrobium sp.]